MKRSPYKHWEYRLRQDREDARMRRMWDEAYSKYRRGPTKYSRTLKGVLACAGALVLMFLAAMSVLAVKSGVSEVVDVLTSPEFVYGTVMRGMIVLIGALFAAYLLAGWIED